MLAPSDQVEGLTIRHSAGAYTVGVGSGTAPAFLQARSAATIIADEIFGDDLRGRGFQVVTMPAVETRKTLDMAGEVIELLRSGGFGRQDRIVAIGGGIVQDVACFVASVYMRGIAWDYCPTTLLGMVDSCIGSKSSINVGRFKNIAGTFHAPDAVLVDVDYVRTLQPQQVAGGLCEAVKICFARGEDAFGRFLGMAPSPEISGPALADLVRLSLKSKQWFIEIDEFDRKERLTLNFGHTFGHAVEAATKFSIEHGLAVGIGTLCAVAFCRHRGAALAPGTQDLERYVRGLLVGQIDPGVIAAFDMAAFLNAFLSDKKHGPDYLTLILPTGGSAAPLEQVRVPRTDASLAEVSAALSSVLKNV